MGINRFTLSVGIFLSICLLIEAQEPIVTTTQGQVQGRTKSSVNGRPYTEFLGLPFAQPPVGNLRFAAPVTPPDSWTGVRDGSVNGPYCAQTPSGDILIVGEDDCLYLNVYSPQLPDETTQPNLPVIVFIFGGGYSRGGYQSYYYGPGRFMDKDVVYVTISYRVGPFGFLSTLDAAASGNFGLLDQVEALKWVQANIAAFGGNPNQVTIQGESAGSASVSYLVLSQAAAGLFHAAIGESGSALCSWALQRDPMKFTIKMAELVNCTTAGNQEIVDCLRNRTVEDLVNAAYQLGDYNLAQQPFVPVVENPAVGKFITEWPLDILNAGTFNKVPYLTGCNHDEGTISYEIAPELYDNINDNFFDVILPAIVYGMFKYDHNLINVSYAIKAEYYDKIDITDSNAVTKTSIDYETDGIFLAVNDNYVKKLASYGLPVYTYIFSYVGGSSLHHFGNYTQVCHADELPYLFEMFTTDSRLNENDTAVSEQLVTFWTNFATYHNPTPTGSSIEWTPVSASESPYLYILLPEETSMVLNYRSEQINFWSQTVTEILLA